MKSINLIVNSVVICNEGPTRIVLQQSFIYLILLSIMVMEITDGRTVRRTDKVIT